MKRLILSMALLSLTSLAFAQKKIDFEEISILVKNAKEKGNLKLADSLAQDYIDNYLFKLKEHELMTKENLSFISDYLVDENSKAFKLFKKQPEKVNVVLGNYMAQKSIMLFVNHKYLPQGDFKKIKKPDWVAIEKIVVAKFGTLGQEILFGQRMIYSLTQEDWESYGIWYKKYFQMGLKHSIYDINNLSWPLFEHINDQDILSYGCDVMKYALKEMYQNDWQSYDTYANLLYKTGRKDQAIMWEEKAMKLSNNDNGIVETLEKMRRGEKTWPN